MSPMIAPKPVEVVTIDPPPAEFRAKRQPPLLGPDDTPDRYSLPSNLDSSSPVGFRHRIPLTRPEAIQVMPLLSLSRPIAFIAGPAPDEQPLFEELSLGVLTARQSTNFRGHRDTVLGPSDSDYVRECLRELHGLEAEALPKASHTHLILCRPYRTPFTMLLTLIGHKPMWSLPQAVLRAAKKRVMFADDIPTIGYLTDLHVGILADALERAAVIASCGHQKAQVFSAPFVGRHRTRNRNVIAELERLAGLTLSDRAQGWRLALVAQVGHVAPHARIDLPRSLARKIGANLMAFRSERIQPGVNQEPKAPEAYQTRQPMDVPEALTFQAGRTAYNAFAHWTGCDREQAKDLLLLDRIDVLTPNGKERLRSLRKELAEVTERIIDNIPAWADLPTARAFSKNAARGKKAFALAGQRIYICGLDENALAEARIDWSIAVRAVGAASARSALYAELMGVTELPEDCDLLAGVCLMAGPVNQNDIGKQFFGYPDLLAPTYPDTHPTSLLVWTLKAKTVADPIGNEDQLLNATRKGALVDLRPGPHEVVQVLTEAGLVPFRQDGDRVSRERAFADRGNFVVADDGTAIAGNEGEAWRENKAEQGSLFG